MFCSQCGNEVTATARFCPTCGSSVGGRDAPRSSAPGGATSSVPNQPAHQAVHPVTFDITRLATGDLVTGGASILFFIALFLPWYSLPFIGSLDALYQGWMYLALLLTLAIIGYLIARALWGAFHTPLPHPQLLIGATGLNLLLTIIAFASVPDGTSWSFGAFMGLITGIGALAGAIIRLQVPDLLHAAPSASGLARQPYSHPAVPSQPTPRVVTGHEHDESTHSAHVTSTTGPVIEDSTSIPVPPFTIESNPIGASSLTTPNLQCAACRASNPPTNKFCDSCGSTLT